MASTMAAALAARTRPTFAFKARIRSIARLVHIVDTAAPLSIETKEGERKPYEVKKYKEGMILRVDIPGVRPDKIKVWVEKDSVCFKGTGTDGSDGKEDDRNFAGRFICSSDLYKLDSFKAEVKDGILRVELPKKTSEI